jgi:multiple sugar transport system substrate-binding protein
MNIKKKKIIKILSITATALFLILILLLVLLNNRSNTQKEITLVYWGFWEETDVMHPLLEKYENENPGVQVLYSRQTEKNYESRTYTRLGQAITDPEPTADIVMIHNTWLPKYQNYLEPLPQTIMNKEVYTQEFYPTTIDDFTGNDGNIYAIPLQIDGLMILYNKDLLANEGYAEPPQDWDTFMEAAKRLTKYDSDGKISQSGLAIGTGRNITHASDILVYFMLQNSVELISEDKTSLNLTSSRAIASLEVYTSFVKGNNSTWATYLPDDLTSFQNGDLAMMFGTTWRALNILEQAPDINFGLAPLPILPNNEKVYYATYWGNAVSKASRSKEEAWKFINFLSEPEQLRRLYQNSAKTRTFGQPYSRVSMNNELLQSEYTNALGIMAPFMQSWQVGDQEFVDEAITNAITSVAEEGEAAERVLKSTETKINERLAVTNK